LKSFKKTKKPMKILKLIIFTVILVVGSKVQISAQETYRHDTAKNSVQNIRSIITLGGGNSMPSSIAKEKTFLSNSTVLNADLFFPLYRKGWDGVVKGGSKLTAGLNFGGTYNFGGSGGFGVIPNPFAVTGQTSSIVSDLGVDPKSPGFRLGAGPQINLYFGKFIVSPMVLGEYFSMTQKEMNIVQTTQFNGQSYDFNLATLPETKTSGFAITPKLRLHYMISPNFGLFADASYTMGPKTETTVSKLIPNGNPQTPGDTYNLQQLQTGTMVNGETKSTAYSSMGINFGVVIGLEGKAPHDDGKGQQTHKTNKGKQTNEKTADDTDDIKKGWNGKTKMTKADSGKNKKNSKEKKESNVEIDLQTKGVPKELSGKLKEGYQPKDEKNNENSCCQNSSWGEMSYMNDKDEVANLPPCGTDLGLLTCNSTIQFKTCYNCQQPCGLAQIKYEIFNGTSLVRSFASSSCTLTPITLPNITGTYSLVISAICGDTVCRTCTYFFDVKCEQTQNSCCDGGKWLSKFYSIAAPLIKTTPINVACDQNYNFDFITNASITFNADYLCNASQTNCNKQVFVEIKNTSDGFLIYQAAPYTMSFTKPGTYSVCYYALCGETVCETCCFTLTVVEKEKCCKNSYWINKSIDWNNNIIKNPSQKTSNEKIVSPPSELTQILPENTSLNIECNQSFKLSLGGTYTFNSDYFCTKNCTKNVKVQIRGLTDSSLDGIYDAPVAKTFTKDGIYMISYIAYCGDEICDRCEFTVGIDKNCCENSNWISADYQIVNKHADGSWKFEPGIFSLVGSSIPTLKADFGIDISNLNFQCAQGCEANYIVRRINQTTGTLSQPDEMLSPGQTTTSIYAKPFLQTIIIIPTCSGQNCGKPIIFRLACLNEGCSYDYAPCIGCAVKDNLVYNGDFEALNTGFHSDLHYIPGAPTNWDANSPYDYSVSSGVYPSWLYLTSNSYFLNIGANRFNHAENLKNKTVWKNNVPITVNKGSEYSLCFNMLTIWATLIHPVQYYENDDYVLVPLPIRFAGNPELAIDVLINGTTVLSGVEVGPGGVVYSTFTHSDSNYVNNTWKPFHVNWVADANTAVIEFKFQNKSYPLIAGWIWGLDDIIFNECTTSSSPIGDLNSIQKTSQSK
jgi:hypothetical protein